MSVLYPNGDDTTFDWDYYLARHIPLVGEQWGAHVERTEVARGVSGAPSGPPAFVAQALIYFADQDALRSAMQSAGTPEILADIPNFTNVQPTMQVDEVV